MHYSLVFAAAAVVGSATASYIPGWGNYNGNGRGYGPGYGGETVKVPPMLSFTGVASPLPSGTIFPTNTGVLPTGRPTGLPPNGPGTTTPRPQSTATKTIYTGTDSTTVTTTVIGTTTAIETITRFVPCSTPVGTAAGSTYYSTYLTVDYETTTRILETTEISVLCPATAIPPQATGGSSSYSSGSSSSSSGSNSGSNPDSNSGSNGSSNQGSSPQASCPASETTVYSTQFVTTTVISTINAVPTPCAACITYHITLPNGQPTSVIVTPTGGSSPIPISKPGGGNPLYPTKSNGGGGPNGPLPTGTSRGTAQSSGTSAPKPNASGAYVYTPNHKYGGWGYD